MIKLGPLRREDMPQLLEWRNEHPEAWRDPRPTTITQQYEWFDGPVSHGPGWYWGVYGEGGNLVGQTELTGLVTGSAEIGAMMNPASMGSGYGSEAVRLTLLQGFQYLMLDVIWGECYECNPAIGFWKHLAEKWNGWHTQTLNRKRWDGKWWHSCHFGWMREMVKLGE